MILDEMILRVTSPEKPILEAKGLVRINVPLVDGAPIGVHPGHHPLIAETDKGSVSYEDREHTYHINLHAGVLDIRDNTVTILTAGKIEETPDEITAVPEETYTRLMETLISKLYPEKERGSKGPFND
jgi:F0F1-type ATP synthase epsilon subunit